MAIKYELYTPFVFANIEFDTPYFTKVPKGYNLYDALVEAQKMATILKETRVTAIDHDTGEVYFDLYNLDEIKAEMDMVADENDDDYDDLADWQAQQYKAFYG